MSEDKFQKATQQSGTKRAVNRDDATAPTLTSQIDEINLDFKERELAKTAKSKGYGYINLKIVPINPDSLRLIDYDDAIKAKSASFFRLGNEVRVASTDPSTKEFADIKAKLEKTGYEVKSVLISEESWQQVLYLYEIHHIKPEDKIEVLQNKDIGTYEKEVEALKKLAENMEKLSDKQLVETILVGAARAGASDIHIQPEQYVAKIRLRIDGELQQILEFPSSMYNKVSMALKFRANMKMNVNNIPQDGKFGFDLSDRQIDVRMSTLPTEFGESIVMRLLDAKKGIVPLEKLGFIGNSLEVLKKAMDKTVGMFLLTGPTGSGKTTTLYSVLNIMNSPDKKVITLEDPIEYHLSNIAQSLIRENDGYTFAAGIRSILRQDPDIVMVGEIRDSETAKIAVQAALTGHFMLSTLHTNSAIGAIPRLLDMDVEPYLLAPALSTIIAQRLVRVLCSECKQAVPIDEPSKKIIDEVVGRIKSYNPDFQVEIPTNIYKSVGCDKCSHSGFSGRMVVVEIVQVSKNIKQMIVENKRIDEILEQAKKEGFITMKEDGILKVLNGFTTIEEVLGAVEE